MPFTNILREDPRPRQRDESSFSFLDRSASPEIGRVRLFLAEAIGRFPDQDKQEIVARLRSESEVHFRSATFEVLLHEALLKLGYSVTTHPDPGTGVAKRPDFLVVGPHGEEFFLEAVLAGERDGRNRAAEAMKQGALARLERAPHNAFKLDVQSDGDPVTQPSGTRLVREAHAWLDALSPEDLRERLITHGLDAMPTITWSHEDWDLTLRAIPIAIGNEGNNHRLIGVFGDGFHWVNAWEPLRDAIKKKANRYGNVTKPFVVAVNSSSFNLDEIDESQALYGQEQWIEVLGFPEQGRVERVPNGAWYGPHGPQNRRASAVWFFNDLTPYSIATRRVNQYLNPWANLTAPDSLLRLPTYAPQGEELVKSDGIDLRLLYELPLGWPEN